MISGYLSFKRAVLATALALPDLAVVGASAQNTAQVQVPFPFVANHASLPAGFYKIISSDTSVTLLDANTGRAQALLLVCQEAGNSESRGRMTFEKSGSRYVLTEVRFAGSTAHSILLGRPKRKRVVADAPKAVAPTVEIAMK